ncbi:hypothetical protein PIB30_072133 [Stylosanthes scabra]|uniref:Mediator of RNA polymerase II transcription subunit 21 n=1 Tax=Stylosanthes scabra TaxID=79078 RepID=A0ABU6WM90_9FABA|nr:hypothetical protein [Stylosanthes scabra]
MHVREKVKPKCQVGLPRVVLVAYLLGFWRFIHTENPWVGILTPYISGFSGEGSSLESWRSISSGVFGLASPKIEPSVVLSEKLVKFVQRCYTSQGCTSAWPGLMRPEPGPNNMQFDALVAALPISEGGEEAQIKRTTELYNENDAIGKELQKQLETAEKELNHQVQDLVKRASDNYLNLKKPE